MGRELEEIEVEEISLVDAASNRKKFYIVKKDNTKKQKAQITIESDGTVKGTKILMGSEEVKDLVDFSFSFYMPRSGDVEGLGKNVSCSYSKVTETEDGFKHTDHFYLSKSLEVKKGMKELKEQLKDLLGEDFSEEDFEKAEKKLDEKVVSALKGALNILNKYKGDFPDELKKAVGVLAKHIGSVKKDLDKAGAKLSKSTLEKIQSAMKALKALNDLLPEESQLKIEKEAVVKDEALKAEFEKIHKALEKLEKGEEGKGKDKGKGKDEDEDKDPLKAIRKRLETIEKAKGIKKSIDGDGETDEGKGDKWPSFNVNEE